MGLEEATLTEIRKSKKGKIHGQIKFADGKSMPIPPGTRNLDETLNNKPCEVLRTKGQVTRLVVDGKELYNVSNTASKSATAMVNNHRKAKYNRGGNFTQGAKGRHQHGNAATAPYNFIPLNETVIFGQNDPLFDKYDNKRFTGYIECELETLTPLYIRDTYTGEELAYKEEQERQGKCGENSDFFSPPNRNCLPRIPGSSIRGMIRTLVEIIGWGRFGCFEDNRRLFYRDVAGNTELGKQYRNMMMYEDDFYAPKVGAGILRRKGNEWAIYPSATINGTQIYKVDYEIKDKRNLRVVAKNTDIRPNEFTFKKIYFKPTGSIEHKHKLNGRNDIKLKYAKVKDVSLKPVEGYKEGYLISSGDFGKKKHMHWIINLASDESSNADYINVNSYSKNLYKSDKNRDEKADLFKMLEKHPAGVPCFYIKNEDKTIFLGHTGMFRLPYNYTIGEYVPEKLTGDGIDMVENIFGKASEFATRVYFEDAKLLPDQSNVVSDRPTIPKILAGPKPTTFQHYLESNDNKASHWNAKSYNKGVQIRGNKLYWHRNGAKWKLDEDEKEKGNANPKLLTKIKPVRSGIEFKFKIRFENLTKEELGLLLCALDLPKDHHHKLGMGKPLGLGSVKITPILYIDDRAARYRKLFNQNQWHLADKEDNIEQFKNDYEKYLLDKLNKQEDERPDSMWDTKRLKQLKTMLSWKNSKTDNWLKKTEYMKKEEFKDRRVLPKPTQILNNKD